MDRYIIEVAKHGLRRHEGLKLYTYPDSYDNDTIGYGHNKDANPYTDKQIVILNAAGLKPNAINLPFAELLLHDDILEAHAGVGIVFPGISESFSIARHAALIDMVFNLGLKRFSGFPKMVAAIRANDWEKAAVEALDSKWARNDVATSRSTFIARALRNG